MNHSVFFRRLTCSLLLAGASLISHHALAQEVGLKEIRWVVHLLPHVHEAEDSANPPGFQDRLLREQLIPLLPEYTHDIVTVPQARRNALLASDPKACAPGMLKSAERSEFVRFSSPVLQILGTGLYALKQNRGRLQPFSDESGQLSLDTWLKDGQLILGIANGRSYGSEIDQFLRERQKAPTLAKIATDQPMKNLAKMLQMRRIDGLLGLSYEASYLIDAGTIPASELEYWPLSGQEALHTIRIGCHQGALGSAVIARIDELLRRADVRAAAQGYYDSLLRPAERSLLRKLRLPP
jgi:uncharacterized protein (TIGR02285 family)